MSIRSLILSVLFTASCGGSKPPVEPAPTPAPATPTATETPPAAPADPCPKVSVSGPNEVDVTTQITYTVQVTGGDPAVKPTFNWITTAGSIRWGEGTSTIIVDSRASQMITASVEVGGYPPQCRLSAAFTTTVK